jgi:hypothetical protein
MALPVATISRLLPRYARITATRSAAMLVIRCGVAKKIAGVVITERTAYGT